MRATNISGQAALEPSANADNAAVGRNALFGYVGWTVNVLTGFIVTPVLLRHLGTSGFGAWTLVFTLTSYVGVVELGLGVATVRAIAAALARRDEAAISEVVASARATYFVMGAFGLVALVGLAALPGTLTSTHGADVTQLRLAVVTLGLGLIFASCTSIYPAIAIGSGRADIGVRVGLVFSLILAAGQISVVLATGSVLALATVTAGCTAAGSLAQRAVIRRRFRYIDLRFARARRAVARSLILSGLSNGIIGIEASVAFQSDVIVVGALLPATAVAQYGVGARAAGVVGGLAGRAAGVLIPTFAHASAIDDRRRTITALRESVFTTRALCALALVALALFGQQLLDLWLEPAPPNSDLILVILVAAMFASASGNCCFVLLTGAGRLRIMLVGGAITAVANLGISVALTWHVGVTGPVIATLVVSSVWNSLYLPRYVSTWLGISWPGLAFGDLPPLVLPLALSAAVGAALRWGVEWDTRAEGAAGAAIVAVVYFASLVITMGDRRRSRYIRVIRAIVGRGDGQDPEVRSGPEERHAEIDALPTRRDLT